MSLSALVIDGNNIAMQAYHTDAGKGLNTRLGKPSGVAHGFLTMLCSLWDKQRPDAIFVVWDRKSRHRTRLAAALKELSPDSADYKGSRHNGDDDYMRIFRPQSDDLRLLMPALGIRSLVVDGVEGDDLMGITADALAAADYEVTIVSTDKDLYQLLSDKIAILNPRTKRTHTLQSFTAANGVPPSQWPEVRALTGDKGDDIPGVKSIGEKTALKMIQTHDLMFWLTCTPEEAGDLHKQANKVQAVAQQVQIAYDMSYILSSPSQLDEDQQKAFAEQWSAEIRPDIDELRRFIDLYELVVVGVKLMDLLSGSIMESVTTLAELREKWGNDCQRCPLKDTRTRQVWANGPEVNGRIACIGEGPGNSEDFQGRGFVGLAGQYLDRLLKFANIERDQVWIMNAVMCRPLNGQNLREPTLGELASCRPRLRAELRIIAPRIAVLLGDSANKALFPHADKISIERGVIKTHPDFPGILFLPVYHPSYLMRLPQGMAGPMGLHGAHSDIVKSREDWCYIARLAEENGATSNSKSG